jgi:hypothetical protein
MKTKLMAMALLAAGSMFAQTRFSVGISVGGHGHGYYAPVAPVRAFVPVRPGLDYDWVEGYWVRDRWNARWVPGYWVRRPHRSGFYVDRYRINDRRDDRRYDDRDRRNNVYDNRYRR